MGILRLVALCGRFGRHLQIVHFLSLCRHIPHGGGSQEEYPRQYKSCLYFDYFICSNVVRICVDVTSLANADITMTSQPSLTISEVVASFDWLLLIIVHYGF